MTRMVRRYAVTVVFDVESSDPVNGWTLDRMDGKVVDAVQTALDDRAVAGEYGSPIATVVASVVEVVP